jgi:hypothetical protein
VYITDNPEPPAELDESAFEMDARRHRRRINSVLSEIAEKYAGTGCSLTAREMADQILADAGFAGTEDPDVLAGVEEVCDRVIKSTPTPVLHGTQIPRIITAHNGKRLSRIPVMNATVAHLWDMIAMREAQIAADQDEISGLVRVARKLTDLAGGDQDAKIGELIGRSLKTEAAAHV